MSSPMGGGARQGILSLVVKDKAALYNAYMPYIRQGGLFVPTPRRYFIGDEVFLLLTLPDSSERLPVAGKVCWVTTHSRRWARHREPRRGCTSCVMCSHPPTELL